MLAPSPDARPGNAEAYYTFGLVLINGGQAREGIALVRRSLDICPNADRFDDLGQLLLAGGRLDEAAIAFQRSVTIAPRNPRTQNNLAVALGRQGKYDEAIAHYRAALQVDGSFTGAQGNLAWLLATCPIDSLRNGGEAVELALEACRATRYKDPQMLDWLAAAYAEAGKFSEALDAAPGHRRGHATKERRPRRTDRDEGSILSSRKALSASDASIYGPAEGARPMKRGAGWWTGVLLCPIRSKLTTERITVSRLFLLGDEPRMRTGKRAQEGEGFLAVAGRYHNPLPEGDGAWITTSPRRGDGGFGSNTFTLGVCGCASLPARVASNGLSPVFFCAGIRIGRFAGRCYSPALSVPARYGLRGLILSMRRRCLRWLIANVERQWQKEASAIPF